MKGKIVIARGTGFIGSYLTEKFQNMGYEVLTISRNKQHVQWDDINGLMNALDHSIMLINLAGKSVDCRYNEKKKYYYLEQKQQKNQVKQY